MRTLPFAVAVASIAAGCRGGGGHAQVTPTTDDQKTLYALGLSIGRNLSTFNLSPAEMDYVFAGMTDQVSNAKPQVEISQWGPKIQEMARKRASAKTDAEKAKGDAFMAKIASEKGVTATPSGLLYVEEQAGSGESPQPTDRVKVNYRGTLIDGTEFDSSASHGNQPAEFQLNQVVPCWTEGLQKMKVNGKAKLYCPSKIAYGDRGQGQKIPGGATLIFDVELVAVTKAPPGAPPAPGAPAMPGMPMPSSMMPPGHPPMPGQPAPTLTLNPHPGGPPVSPASPHPAPPPPAPAPAHP